MFSQVSGIFENTDVDPLAGIFLFLSSIQFQPLSVKVIIAFFAFIILVICSALISGAEVAFFSLTPSQIQSIRSQRIRKNLHLLELLEQPKKLLATILISNNFINVAIVILSTYITANLLIIENNSFLVFFIQVILVTAILLIFGEIMPKMLAAHKSLRFSYLMSPAFRFLLILLHPLSQLLMRSSSFIDNRISRKNITISLDDLSHAVELTSDPTTPYEEKKILKGIVKFSDIEAKEIMKPRLDVTAVEISTRYHKLLEIILQSGYSRIPVYKDNFDQISGILYVKDLLPHLEKPDDFNWTELLRPAFFVPETKKINYLLQEFQERKIHLAIVVDEYGGTSGIVTLEDIIEEIVGEISDEFDTKEDEINYTKVDDHTYIFEGKTLLNDFCKILNIEDSIFEDIQGHPDTLAGLIIELEGKIPELNHCTNYKNFEFKIIKAGSRRIEQIQVKLPFPEQTNASINAEN